MNLFRGLLLDECVKMMASRMTESYVSKPKGHEGDDSFDAEMKFIKVFSIIEIMFIYTQSSYIKKNYFTNR